MSDADACFRIEAPHQNTMGKTLRRLRGRYCHNSSCVLFRGATLLVVNLFYASPSGGLLHAAAAEPSSHRCEEDRRNLPTGTSPPPPGLNRQPVWSTVGKPESVLGESRGAKADEGNNLSGQKKLENDKKTKGSNTAKVWQMCTDLPSLSA